jgi:DNA-binding LytR/AlgR family response regulator
MKVLIIEDEPQARNELKRLLQKSGRDFTILDEIDSVEDAVDWFQNNPEPDLVFLDIQLSDGLSFGIFKKVRVPAPVIFTTAFDEYAIRAFEVNSIAYLLKPINPEALGRALEKLDELKKRYQKEGNTSFLTDDQMTMLMKLLPASYKTRFMVRLGEQFLHVGIEEVAYFLAEDNVVFLLSHSGKRYIIEYTLEDLESRLDPLQFFRLNRGVLASIGSIKKVSRYFNSRLAIELSPATEEKVIMSRVRVQEFLRWMDR